MDKRMHRIFLFFLILAVLPLGFPAPGAGEDAAVRTSQPRYLAIGFDDFRTSDFTTVWPLLGQYDDARATFNKISRDLEYDPNVEFFRDMGMEIGDHTWFHESFYILDPLLNGQDPSQPEGDQVPFPTNDQMRADRGDGKNAFGYDLTEPCMVALNRNRVVRLSSLETPWGELTDEECQELRESFSIMKDHSGLLETFDLLSNTYLGTSGASAGSWNEAQGCYTGGIFTGCKTSANHEIWERVLQVTQLFFKEMYGFRPVTWSMPGADRSAFFFEKDGIRYYDEACTVLYNHLARMPSSLYTEADGSPKSRSWVEALRENGYLITHDAMYPSRMDGTEPTMMRLQLFLGANRSRRDALVYPTNFSGSYREMADAYPEEFFDAASGKTAAEQMYDGGGVFRDFIESIRMNTSGGMVQGEVIDSSDSDSFAHFLSAVLDYCRATGVHVVSKKEAFEICFGDEAIPEDNLIFNRDLVNTAAAFLPGAETVPANPDGYQGDCSVPEEDTPTLQVAGKAWYLHYGIPLGELCYEAAARGEGSIRVYAIRNRDRVSDAQGKDAGALSLLAEGTVSSGEYAPFTLRFTVPDAPETAWEQQWEGLGEKIMGIRIEYTGDLRLREISLRQEDQDRSE